MLVFYHPQLELVVEAITHLRAEIRVDRKIYKFKLNSKQSMEEPHLAILSTTSLKYHNLLKTKILFSVSKVHIALAAEVMLGKVE